MWGFSSVSPIEIVVSIFILYDSCDKIKPDNHSHPGFIFQLPLQVLLSSVSLGCHSRGKLYRQNFSLLFDDSFFSDSLFFPHNLPVLWEE